jgi:hypothetical protein
MHFLQAVKASKKIQEATAVITRVSIANVSATWSLESACHSRLLFVASLTGSIPAAYNFGIWLVRCNAHNGSGRTHISSQVRCDLADYRSHLDFSSDQSGTLYEALYQAITSSAQEFEAGHWKAGTTTIGR